MKVRTYTQRATGCFCRRRRLRLLHAKPGWRIGNGRPVCCRPIRQEGVFAKLLVAGVTIGDVKTGTAWSSPSWVRLESVGDWLRFDENGPLAQPVMLVTMAAIDSPRTSASSKRPALILMAVMLTEVTAWAAFSLWGVTLPPVTATDRSVLSTNVWPSGSRDKRAPLPARTRASGSFAANAPVRADRCSH